ncbi:acyl-CoA dehydrogenase [Bradyrhizobium sp. Ce-3]|uniref:acyl-CoA dehydrogenase n=1 Tax=Bradyrhizobium sp. Ce-3 TaxID=2913970 RepID=UPI001FC8E7E2|nr:acyl-CoA dehydrogenase [Bradyrhizobium sp. Ce-3]GKQ55085.1 acyl-CoA dehydrogenase [Bradyrhizobium sp. Ce-3]
MDFARGESDEIIAETIGRFAADELRPRLREFESARMVGESVRERFAALGFEALDIAEQAGGAGLGLLARVRTNRLLAEVDAGAALALDRFAPAIYVVEEFGGVEILKSLAPDFGRSKVRFALVMDHDAGAVAGARVAGQVAWTPAARADVLVGLGPQGAWVLQEGFAFEPVRGAALHAAGASSVRFDGTPILTWHDPLRAARALARIRVYYASLILGVLSDAAGFSRGYALDRVAFGKPIAHHQALAFLIVDMFVAVERLGLLIEDAARAIDAGEGRAIGAAAAAFVDAVEASRFIGPNGVQILGGHGFMRDFPVEKAMRDCRALGLLAGGCDAAREQAGAALAATISERSVA